MKVIIALVAVALFSLAAADLDITGPAATVNAYIRGLDNIANKYGNFNSPLSYSSGAAKTLNTTVTGNFFLPPPFQGTNLGYIVPDLLAFLTPIALPTITYVESGVRNYTAYSFAVSGLSTVATDLFLAGLLGPKLYSQRQLLGLGPVVGNIAQVNLTYTVSVSGLVATDACQANPFCFPGSESDPNLTFFTQIGSVTFQLVLQFGAGYTYKIASITNIGGYTIKAGQFVPGTTNFGPW